MNMKWLKTLLLSALCLAFLAGCARGASDGGKKGTSSDIQLGDSFEESNSLAEGSLQVTVKSAERITDVSELPPQELFFENYDHHVLSDGTMKEGSSFILRKLEVKSLDAAAKLDRYNDPYVFRADDLLTLIDLTEKQGKNYYYIPVDYFSLYGQESEHSLAFRLSPGETVEFEVGYFVGKKRDGSERDLSQLRACTTSGNANSDFVDLKLGEDRDD